MTTKENKVAHQKHARLERADLGYFGRRELAILGTPCGQIKKLSFALIARLSPALKVAYVDADHKSADAEAAEGLDLNSPLAHGAYLDYTDKITYQRFDYKQYWNELEQKALFQKADLVLVNGNHFPAKCQIAVIDPAKPLEKKLDKLTDVRLILLGDNASEVPDYIRQHVPDIDAVPVMRVAEVDKIAAWVQQFYQSGIAPLFGLVLAGGKSTRMQQDKGALQYHGADQRTHVRDLLQPFCQQVYVSCNAAQVEALAGKLPYLEDRFVNLGPKGGILTALQLHPNAAWLAVACDLPFLSAQTLQYLVEQRDPTKMATAFYDSEGRFPEPLLTIWEPRSYGAMLQFLSMGYSCPRKVLINSDVKLLTIPDVKELRNVNDPDAYEQSLAELGRKE